MLQLATLMDLNAQNISKKRLLEVYNDTSLIQLFTYNDSGFIDEVKSKLIYKKYAYNPMGQLVSVDVYSDPAIVSSSSFVIEESRNRKEWAGPDILEKSHSTYYKYDKDGQLIESSNYLGYNLYTYEQSRISKMTYYHDGVISSIIEFKYDRKGNLKERLNYQVSENQEKLLMRKTTFKYDTKKNPYASFHNPVIPGLYSNPNNVLWSESTTSFRIEGMADQTHSESFSYTYDTDAYPITKNRCTQLLYEYIP